MRHILKLELGREETMKTPQHYLSGQLHARGLLVAAGLFAVAAFAASPAAWPQSGATLHPSQMAAQKAPAARPAAQQKLFSTPEEARDALVAAAVAKDQAAMTAIFGPEHDKLKSGDPVADEGHAERFAAHLQEAATLEKVTEGKYTLFVGAQRFPFPIPIVKDGDKWRFDTHAGLEEILNRRIGENELSAIMTCRAYVLAQWEFFTLGGNHNEDGLAEYAPKFVSSPGKHDGLFWETGPGEDPSPLGPLVAQARAEGYEKGTASGAAHVQPARVTKDGAAETGQPQPHAPYHGYYFRILTRQGLHAPGGGFSYLINGHMIAGFALVAYPDKWGNSGVMTFIVNTQGRVYEKNMGPKTAQIALAMTEYNPDPTWKLVPKN